MPDVVLFFLNDTATTEIYTLSLHDALPICWSCTPAGSSTRGPNRRRTSRSSPSPAGPVPRSGRRRSAGRRRRSRGAGRSEEHTSELQSRQYLVCRLLLEKKKIQLS